MLRPLAPRLFLLVVLLPCRYLTSGVSNDNAQPRFRDFFDDGIARHKIDKYDNYLDIYDNKLGKFWGSNVTLLEIGVHHGGSLEMWRWYFGEGLNLWAMDIVDKPQVAGANFIRGDQGSHEFWTETLPKLPMFDIVIEDGGHTMKQQILTFKMLFYKMNLGGVYLCEDIHTAYWPEFGGGINRKGTSMSFFQRLTHALNYDHVLSPQARDRTAKVNLTWTRRMKSIQFFDSVVAIDIGEHSKQKRLNSGWQTIP